jgi:hypothetical protein
MGKMRNAYNVLCRNPVRKRPLGKHKRRWEGEGRVWIGFIRLRIRTSGGPL